MAAYLSEAYRVNVTRSCKVACLCKSMYYYEPTKDDSPVISIFRELAEKRPNEGQDKLYARLRQQGYGWNYKRVRRVYLLMGLNKRRKPRKRLPSRDHKPLCQTSLANEPWSMDFMHDALINKRRFRTLNIIDDYNRTYRQDVLNAYLFEHMMQVRILTEEWMGIITSYALMRYSIIKHPRTGKGKDNAVCSFSFRLQGLRANNK